jgi:ankyrin repeat protein
MSGDFKDASEENIAVLFTAAEQGRTDIIKIVAEKGVPVSEQRKEDGVTALHLAASEGHVDCVRALLRLKCNVMIRDDEEKTAYEIANADCRRAFEAEFFQRVAMGLGDEILQLLKAGVDVNSTDGSTTDETAMHWAASFGHTETVRLLIEQGADVNVRNKQGATPLHEAAHSGHEATFELLLKSGADSGFVGEAGYSTGKTAVDTAAAASAPRLKHLIETVSVNPAPASSREALNGDAKKPASTLSSSSSAPAYSGLPWPGFQPSFNAALHNKHASSDRAFPLLWPPPQRCFRPTSAPTTDSCSSRERNFASCFLPSVTPICVHLPSTKGGARGGGLDGAVAQVWSILSDQLRASGLSPAMSMKRAPTKYRDVSSAGQAGRGCSGGAGSLAVSIELSINKHVLPRKTECYRLTTHPGKLRWVGKPKTGADDEAVSAQQGQHVVIEVVGSDSAGLLYGTITLMQLLRHYARHTADNEKAGANAGAGGWGAWLMGGGTEAGPPRATETAASGALEGVLIPALVIEDWPTLSTRGTIVDLRGWAAIRSADLQRFIYFLAYSKCNQLQLRLGRRPLPARVRKGAALAERLRACRNENAAAAPSSIFWGGEAAKPAGGAGAAADPGVAEVDSLPSSTGLLTCEELLQLQELCSSLCIELVPMLDVSPLDLDLDAPVDADVAAAEAVASEREREREQARRQELAMQVSVLDREQYELLSVFSDETQVAFVVNTDDAAAAFNYTGAEASAASSAAAAAVGRKLGTVAPQMAGAQVWGMGGCYGGAPDGDMASEEDHGRVLGQVASALQEQGISHCVRVAVENTNAGDRIDGAEERSGGLFSARAAAELSRVGVGTLACAGGLGSCSSAAWPATATATSAMVNDLTAAAQVASTYGGGGSYVVGEQTSIRGVQPSLATASFPILIGMGLAWHPCGADAAIHAESGPTGGLDSDFMSLLVAAHYFQVPVNRKTKSWVMKVASMICGGNTNPATATATTANAAAAAAAAAANLNTAATDHAMWELVLAGRLRRSVTFHTVRASVRSLQELQESLQETEPPVVQRGMIQNTLNAYYQTKQQSSGLSVQRSPLPPLHPRAYSFEFQHQHQQHASSPEWGARGGGLGYDAPLPIAVTPATALEQEQEAERVVLRTSEHCNDAWAVSFLLQPPLSSPPPAMPSAVHSSLCSLVSDMLTILLLVSH